MCCNSACFSMLVDVLATVFELCLLLCATWYFTGRQKKEDIFVRLVDSSTKAVSGPSTDYSIGRCVLHCVVNIHTYCMLAAYIMCVCDALILCCVVCHCRMQSLTSMGGLWFPSCSQLRMREQAKALISRGFCWHTCWSAGLYSCYSRCPAAPVTWFTVVDVLILVGYSVCCFPLPFTADAVRENPVEIRMKHLRTQCWWTGVCVCVCVRACVCAACVYTLFYANCLQALTKDLSQM